MGDRTTLHTRAWGSGHRIALLLHGQLGSSASWWQVGPTIAARGYRVVAVDLPGHGESAADPTATLESCVHQIVDVCPSAELAIGHSLGGLVLAASADRLGTRRTIFVDTPLRYELVAGPDEMRRRLVEMQTARTLAWLERHRSDWTDDDRRAEADAAERFDVDTSLSLMISMSGLDLGASLGDTSLVIAPDPSRYVSIADGESLERRGVPIRRIEGAGHTVWYGHRDEFMAAIDAWLSADGTRS